MRISTAQHGAVVEVIAEGRLDESWADHLRSALDDVVRRGTHHVRLNMEAVTYLSSAGIGVLMCCYNDLKQINGSFAVTAPSKRVRKILEMASLGPLLLTDLSGAAPVDAPVEYQRAIHTENGLFEVLEAHETKALACRVIGDHQSLQRGNCAPGDMSQVRFPAGAFGLGIGAFGSDYSECRDRFGEFVAAGGAAAYLPTDGASAPDYLVATGSLVPEVAMLYGIRCEGSFTHHLRFAPSDQARDVGLSEIVSTCLKTADAETAGMVIVAESTGLVGAALRRSPATERNNTASRFDHPNIRKWVTFTAEPAHAGSLCLVVGVASDGAAAGPLQPLLRPVSRAGTGISGHFHAAAFPYRPIQQGRLELDATVGVLFENQGPKGLLHLLWDGREATGAGESRFVRGACWVAPIREFSAL
jgi:anti-anti-sigma factor